MRKFQIFVKIDFWPSKTENIKFQPVYHATIVFWLRKKLFKVKFGGGIFFEKFRKKNFQKILKFFFKISGNFFMEEVSIFTFVKVITTDIRGFTPFQRTPKHLLRCLLTGQFINTYYLKIWKNFEFLSIRAKSLFIPCEGYIPFFWPKKVGNRFLVEKNIV